ncbi:MAG: CRISPR-associated endonuclease Cas1 [Bacteroidetes bacterium HGW-Bacteroidetes-7]|jgi:CRISPR-associated protein Cas1|nr:MAG: CRISPR-associated endonuclease Cas1 [Bacteroidetes bacterium HGW-Bacteroidetes-7]
MQVVLDTRGMQMSVRNGCFLFASETESHIVHPERINSILITSPCRISSSALILASTTQIPVIICDNCGTPLVRTWSPLMINTSKLRRGQYRFSLTNESAEWANIIMRIKIEGQKSNLTFMANRKPIIEKKVIKAINAIDNILARAVKKNDRPLAEQKKQILFNEAFAASQYWQLIGLALPIAFQFSNRIKRNPSDAFNACINYLYGMLRNQVETAVLSIGLDPALGIIHRDGYKMPSLVFDMMEPFRPIIDRLLINSILCGEMRISIIQENEGKILITKEGRKQLITMFVKKLNSNCIYRGIRTSLNNHILSEAKLLATKIKGSEI